ncbi:MAG: FRG domain-containing protein [Clostridia bacterium]|nr:FRG domain-containing protein [Clostridia bacterium]
MKERESPPKEVFSMNQENSVFVKSCSEFVHAVEQIETKLKYNGMEYQERLWFRGQSNKEYQLLPAIAREHTGPCAISLFWEERNIIETTKNHHPEIFTDCLYPMQLLTLLQHYGVPTRLLDITKDSMVALYFACLGDKDKDGEVIAFKYNDCDVARYPMTEAIADSYRFASYGSITLSAFLDDVMAQDYFTEQRARQQRSKRTPEQWASWLTDNENRPLFVHAQRLSTRQRRQQGDF